MNLKQLLGSSFDCRCGRHHKVPTRYLVYDAEVFTSLPAVIGKLQSKGSCLVIADSRTFAVAGKTVVEILTSSGISVTSFIVPDNNGEPPEATDSYRDLILASTAPADLYVAVGSGVINDLVKWTAYLRKTPYVVFATAASMNGYASANVAANIEGLKVLFHAQAPLAVFAHPQIIIDAPEELSTAGLGDVLAKSVSSADWKMNQFLFADYYCQFSVDLLRDLEPTYLNNPGGIKKKSPESFEALFKALFYSSIAMTITATSSPASGGEHLISHTLDIIAARDGYKHDYHGRQVGVSSILMAGLYEKIMAITTPQFQPLPPGIDKPFWGSLASIVENEYSKKIPKMEQAVQLLSQQQKWRELSTLLRPSLISAKALKHCLKQAGAAHSYADIRINNLPLERDQFEETVNHAREMRDRFTVLDLAALLGVLPRQTGSLTRQWSER